MARSSYGRKRVEEARRSPPKPKEAAEPDMMQTRLDERPEGNVNHRYREKKMPQRMVPVHAKRYGKFNRTEPKERMDALREFILVNQPPLKEKQGFGFRKNGKVTKDRVPGHQLSIMSPRIKSRVYEKNQD